MNSFNLFYLIILTDNVYSFKPDYGVKMPSKSIFSNNKHTETVIPARYMRNRNNQYDRSATDHFMPDQYFPEVEYPTNVIEASNPFYFKAGNTEALLTHFPDDVRRNFKSARAKPVLGSAKPKIINEYEVKPKPVKQRSVVFETVEKPMPVKQRSVVFETVEKPMPVKQKKLVSKTVETSNVTVTEPTRVQEHSLQKLLPKGTSLVSPMENQISEKIISPETEQEYIEDEYYETDYPEDWSIENVTTSKFYVDEIEVFDDYELLFDSDSFKRSNISNTYNNTSIVSEFVSNETSSSNNSTSKEEAKNESAESETVWLEETFSPSETAATHKLGESETAQLRVSLLTENDKTKSNIVMKPSKKLGTGPMLNTKKRKLLQKLYTIPTVSK